MFDSLLTAFVGGTVVTALAMLALRPVAVAIDLVDRPGGRKTHHGNVPIVGGLAMLMGLVVGNATLSAIMALPALFVAACALLVVLGLLDDRFELSAPARLLAHAAIVLSVSIGMNLVVRTIGDPFGAGPAQFSGWGAYAVTFLFVAGAINAFNMLDGMDGLAGAMSFVALAAFGWIGFLNESLGVVAISFLMCGAVLGFLIFNVPMAFNRDIRCFMGDSGSTLLGFVLAYQGMSISQGAGADVSPVTVLWLAAMPIYELLWTMIRRTVRGRSPFSADREHMHHLLQDAGFGVRAAFVVLVAFGVVFASCGVLMHVFGAPDWLSFVLFIGCGVATIRSMYLAPTWLLQLPQGWQRLAAKSFRDPATR